MFGPTFGAWVQALTDAEETRVQHDAMRADSSLTPCWAHVPPQWRDEDCTTSDCRLHACSIPTKDPLGLCGKHWGELLAVQ